MRKIEAYVFENLTNKINVGDICRNVGYSRSYLSLLFKSLKRETLANYINLCKIDRAKVLIRSHRYSFTEISDLLAFDNPQYFSRVFRRICGLSPSEFAKTLELNH